MANARQCDRCNSLYENYNMINDELKPNAIIFTTLLDSSDYFSRSCLDLCPNCMEEIKKWFREKGRDINRKQIIESQLEDDNTK